MGTKLRVFQVRAGLDVQGKSTPATLLEDVVLDVDGDAAREAAKKYLSSDDRILRSLNWGPGLDGKAQLIAYVLKKV